MLWVSAVTLRAAVESHSSFSFWCVFIVPRHLQFAVPAKGRPSPIPTPSPHTPNTHTHSPSLYCERALPYNNCLHTNVSIHRTHCPPPTQALHSRPLGLPTTTRLLQLKSASICLFLFFPIPIFPLTSSSERDLAVVSSHRVRPPKRSLTRPAVAFKFYSYARRRAIQKVSFPLVRIHLQLRERQLWAALQLCARETLAKHFHFPHLLHHNNKCKQLPQRAIATFRTRFPSRESRLSLAHSPRCTFASQKHRVRSAALSYALSLTFAP